MDFNSLNHNEPPFEKHRRWISWIVDILLIVIFAIFIAEMFTAKIDVSGRSMEPELSSDDVVLINKMKYNLTSPKRMDIICFTLDNQSNDSQVYVKRIVGLPYETVQIKDGYVYINDEVIDKDDKLYQTSVAGLAENPIVLGEDEYFVLGDNRSSSEDSRFSNIGVVDLSQIEGKVWFRLSPFEKIKIIK